MEELTGYITYMHFPRHRGRLLSTTVEITDIADINFENDMERSNKFGLYNVTYVYPDYCTKRLDTRKVTIGCTGSEIKYRGKLYTSKNMQELYKIVKQENIIKALNKLEE